MSNTILQPAAFLAMMYGGIAAGIAYDVFRLLRRVLKYRAVTTAADLLFVLVGAAITAASLMYASGGAIRPFLLLGLLTGFLLQQWSLSCVFFHAFYTIRAHFTKK